MITIIMARGIGEKLNDNLLWNSLRPLISRGVGPSPVIRFVDLDWPAQYGPVGGGAGRSYVENLGVGMDMLRDEVGRAGEYHTHGGVNKIFLVGFSAGSTLVGNYAALWGGHQAGSGVHGVGMVADPMRPIGEGAAGYAAPGYGVGGERLIPRAGEFKAWWISDPRDMITSAPDRSPLRTIADQTWAMSFAPGKFPEWIGDLTTRLKKQRWQPSAIDWSDPLGTLRRYGQAIDDAAGYLFRGEHVRYATRSYPGAGVMGGPTYIEVLAGLIIKEINQ